MSAMTPALRRRLLRWYDKEQRDLPWRHTSDSYAIWLSEIMLQQTRVAVVIDRFHDFMRRFPTVRALAKASEDEVLALWSGLGYYRRARMLHQAAQLLITEWDGEMPRTAAKLLKLPGIGAYTAAAIASIAFNQRIAVVDGNVERVLCRLQGLEGSAKTNAHLRKEINSLASELVDPLRPGDFNQAMMELGATVCLPRNPACTSCPIVSQCSTRGEHRTTPRKPMQTVHVAHALLLRTARKKGSKPQQAVLLQQRPRTVSVMPGLWELPPLRDSDAHHTDLMMTVRHAIMQVNYTVSIRTAPAGHLERLLEAKETRRWIPLTELATIPLTGLTRKVLARSKLLDDAPGRLKLKNLVVRAGVPQIGKTSVPGATNNGI